MMVLRLVALVFVVALIVSLTGAGADGSPSDMSRFIGRLHPALVHLPIGILIVGLILEFLRRRRKTSGYERAIGVVLFVGALSAILAALTGLQLARPGGYDASTVIWHQWLGVAVAVVAVGLFWGAGLKPRLVWVARTRHALWWVLLPLIVAVGHLGGELTHGSGYTTKYLPDVVRNALGLPRGEDVGRIHLDRPAEALVFRELIAPILSQRCVSCHSDRDKEGKLALHTPEAIMSGGDGGDVVKPGRARESELVRRIWLPQGDADHMPPSDRPQMSVAEAELIRWWIDQGASFDLKLGDAEITEPVHLILTGMGLGEIQTGIFALDIPAADSSHLEALSARGVRMSAIAEGAPFLSVSLEFPSAADASVLQSLGAIAPQIAWFSLDGTSPADSVLRVVGEMTHLLRLDLSGTTTSDSDLQRLGDWPYLEVLNLYGTEVSNASLAVVESLTSLRTVYLWGTRVEEEGARRLRQSRPGLEVVLGWSETEETGGS
jgi:uncharacterized membrane protein